MFEHRGVTDVTVQGGTRSILNLCKVTSFVFPSKGSSSPARLWRYKSSPIHRPCRLRSQTPFDHRPPYSCSLNLDYKSITLILSGERELELQAGHKQYTRSIGLETATRWLPLLLLLPVPPRQPLQQQQRPPRHPPTFPRSLLWPNPSRPRSNPPGPSFLPGPRARGTLSLRPVVKR